MLLAACARGVLAFVTCLDEEAMLLYETVLDIKNKQTVLDINIETNYKTALSDSFERFETLEIVEKHVE